jgi:MFS transporter, DHA2 family, multidrug resistance protein
MEQIEHNKKGLGLFIATTALALGSFMNVLDSTIVNVSVSHIAGSFSVSSTQGTWAITSYAVSEAIMLPLTGWLTQRFGILKQYVVATLLFTLASILCGLSPTFEFLLFARVLQGVVGASMIPLSQTLLLSLYPPSKKGLATGIWAMTVVIAPVAGPILGGWITDNWSWHWSFYINIPFGIFSSFAVWKIFKDMGYKDKTQKIPVDYIGIALLTVGVGALQIMLDKANDLDWFSSPIIIGLALTSFVCIISLIIWEWHQDHPIINLSLFKQRNFVLGVVILSLGSTAFFSTVVVLPLWLQGYMGYTAFKSGLTTATTSVFVIFIAPILGANLHKFDVRKIVAFGFIVFFIVSFFGAHLTPDVTSSYLSINRLFLGIGLACFFIPLTSITFSETKPKDMAAASGLSNFMRNIGNSFGTSLVTNFWQHFTTRHHATLAQLAQIDQMITSQAALMAINDIMLYSGIIMLCLIPLVMFAKKPDHIIEGGGH